MIRSVIVLVLLAALTSPAIAQQGQAQSQGKTVAALPVDIWLAPHTFMFGLVAKHDRLQQSAGGRGVNPYVDPDGYRSYVAGRRADFLEEFRKQMTP